MNYQVKVPSGPLAAFVDFLWFYEAFQPQHRMERVLPHGAMELIIDLRPEPKRLFDRDNLESWQQFRRGWFSGAHSRFIVIEAMPGSSMMGVHFKPGGGYPFLGFPATELRDAVAELEVLWGHEATLLRDQLLEMPTPTRKFEVLERFLSRRLRTGKEGSPMVTWAMQKLRTGADATRVETLAEASGVSHKHFINEFAKWVGLTPKRFGRIQRFQKALSEIHTRRRLEWTAVAHDCGYFDQAHFIHDFQAFSGLNPSGYLTVGGEYSNYVPLDGPW